METVNYRDAIFKGDDKAIRDFVKLLLGRLVFIQFVQKKRWMGVPSTSSGWENGQTDFLYNAFKKFPNKSLFYSQFLEPLFYETLNNPNRPNNIFQITGTKVPYLNGGLFENGKTNTSLVNFPEVYFNDLLEFFDRYNFTINEYDPAEHEVGIDPEMLGHIFENLLEDNKDKGAFYTPKEIVHYMCQESLKEYLKTYLNEKSIAESSELDNALEAFVKRKEAANVIEYDEHLATALRDVKICDPAIGSGAFPMGLLNEIYHCVYVLYNASPDVVGHIWGMNTWAPDVVKKNIIQNSIYGVDIEKGAVDIARLRFWLSLIIDEPEPHALPNLDYKIVVGNSLVSKLGDEIIDIDWSIKGAIQGEIFGNESALVRKSLLERISREQKEFFNPECNKKKLAEDIRGLKIDLLIAQFEQMVKAANLDHEPKSGNFADSKKFAKAMEHYLKTLSWKDTISKLKKLKSKPDQLLNFFDWKLDFPEVMNENVSIKVGFDIVIGNPPYGARFSEVDKHFFKNKYNNKDSETESYILFLELGGKLKCKKGSLWYIIPSNISTNPRYNIIRKHILDCYTLLMIIDLGSNIFESASVDSCIFSFKNSKSKATEFRCGIISSRDIETSELKLFEQKYFLSTPQNIFNFYINIETSELLEKIKSNASHKLSDFIDFFRGIEFGYSSDYVYENKEGNRKPLIAGRCFSRYVIKFENKFVKVNFSEPSNFKTKAIYENPKIFVRRIGKEIIAYLDTENFYNVCDVYNLLPTSDKVDLYEILGIINSKCVNFFFSHFFKNAKELFPKIPIKYLKEVPVKLSKGKISKLAKTIQEKRKLGKDTSALEQQIDNLVYRLYDLTYDEVKVVDPEFGLSEEEYNNIRIE